MKVEIFSHHKKVNLQNSGWRGARQGCFEEERHTPLASPVAFLKSTIKSQSSCLNKSVLTQKRPGDQRTFGMPPPPLPPSPPGPQQTQNRSLAALKKWLLQKNWIPRGISQWVTGFESWLHYF